MSTSFADEEFQLGWSKKLSDYNQSKPNSYASAVRTNLPRPIHIMRILQRIPAVILFLLFTTVQGVWMLGACGPLSMPDAPLHVGGAWAVASGQVFNPVQGDKHEQMLEGPSNLFKEPNGLRNDTVSGLLTNVIRMMDNNGGDTALTAQRKALDRPSHMARFTGHANQYMPIVFLPQAVGMKIAMSDSNWTSWTLLQASRVFTLVLLYRCGRARCPVGRCRHVDHGNCTGITHTCVLCGCGHGRRECHRLLCTLRGHISRIASYRTDVRMGPDIAYSCTNHTFARIKDCVCDTCAPLPDSSCACLAVAATGRRSRSVLYRGCARTSMVCRASTVLDRTGRRHDCEPYMDTRSPATHAHDACREYIVPHACRRLARMVRMAATSDCCCVRHKTIYG